MKKSKNSIKLNTIFLVLAFFCFVIISYRLFYLTTSKTIDGRNIKDFADDRSVYETKINAKRGTIFDVNGDVLARNVSSYTLIAYLDSSRVYDGVSYYVKDKEKTASLLATVISLTKEEILDILNQDGLYQVEFGYAGKDLTELQKEKIESLNLPGIDFIESVKRYYPNGDFASYTIGYCKNDSDGNIKGELGIEALLNEQLSGVSGHTSYQVDVNGYKIAGTKEYTVPAKDGNNVYLTIDSNIQFFVEQAVNKANEKYDYDWMIVSVVDAKTGAILAVSQSPSYNPNILNIENYMDLLVSSPYEPGSIMKIYTYMAAMENGNYDGSKKYLSGEYKLDDGTIIYDWNKYGWGEITYDQGFVASSNVGVINIVNNFIDKNILKKYFEKMGFGEKTGITLYNEQKGKVNFKYQSEVYTAAFGQGITTTPIQQIRALTSIANDGVILNPYIISKVTDSDGNVIYEGKKEEYATVASHSTVEKIKELMNQTVDNTWEAATATGYFLDGYNLIGKTGTSQLVLDDGTYSTNDYFTIKSFAGMWPKDDPEVIIFISVKKSANGTFPLTETVKSIVKDVSKYLNLFDEQKADIKDNYQVENYINKNLNDVVKKLKNKNINYVILGNGNKIIDQYPKKDYILSSNEKIIFKTNDNEYLLPNLNLYSKKEVKSICSMLNIDCVFEGYGYLYYQSKEGIIKKGEKIDLKFKEIY